MAVICLFQAFVLRMVLILYDNYSQMQAICVLYKKVKTSVLQGIMSKAVKLVKGVMALHYDK